jgi:hypothetical protein
MKANLEAIKKAKNVDTVPLSDRKKKYIKQLNSTFKKR